MQNVKLYQNHVWHCVDDTAEKKQHFCFSKLLDECLVSALLRTWSTLRAQGHNVIFPNAFLHSAAAKCFYWCHPEKWHAVQNHLHGMKTFFVHQPQITSHYSVSFLGSQNSFYNEKTVWRQFGLASRAHHDYFRSKWETQLPQPKWPAFALWLMLISDHQMLQHVLEQGFTKRLEVTRQLVNARRRVDLLIAPFHNSVCSCSVKYNEEYFW